MSFAIIIAKGQSIIGVADYTITQANIDAGSVTNSAYATGLFQGKTITSPQDVAIVLYEHPLDLMALMLGLMQLNLTTTVLHHRVIHLGTCKDSKKATIWP